MKKIIHYIHLTLLRLLFALAQIVDGILDIFLCWDVNTKIIIPNFSLMAAKKIAKTRYQFEKGE